MKNKLKDFFIHSPPENKMLIWLTYVNEERRWIKTSNLIKPLEVVNEQIAKAI